MPAANDTSGGVAIYRRLLAYAMVYWRVFLLAIFGMIIYSTTDVAFSSVIKPMLDKGFSQKDGQALYNVALLIIVIFAVRVVGNFLSNFFMVKVARNVVWDLRAVMFKHLLRLPSAYYDRTSSGGLVSKMVYDIEQVADASSQVIIVFVQDSLAIIGLLLYMFYQSVQLTLILLVITPLLAAVVVSVSRRFRKLSKRIQSSMGNVSTVTEETIDANREIKIFGGQAYELRQFHEINTYNRKQYLKYAATNAISSPIIEFMVALAFAAILLFASKPAVLASMSSGKFTSFMVAMLLLMQHARKLTTINASLQRGVAAAESIFKFLDEKTENDTGTNTLARVQGRVEFHTINFGYTATASPVLQHIDLVIEAGKSVALVGRSGAGKTSLISLLPRFYEYHSGRITIDGHDIKQLSLENLRSHIALVSQHVTLFNDTIAHNLAYGALGKASLVDIHRAAQAAHAMEFIDKLPAGFDTIVGENGVLLSGGQRQRLAIARAILKNAPILILDEATSALDTESERHIQAALEELMKNRTSLIIAHRLSTIEKVDSIVVLQEGKIIEQGNHRQLLAANGAYARLHKLQFTLQSTQGNAR
ncbi:MAG: lipid A export permease/ATP-binding protein MsbA [Gammaproteobacteria bacterium]|nr:lipid A export permease/ATP-binding protein MsbA [Gammaproteobacteria bacterium]